jgi:hypothetical protein
MPILGDDSSMPQTNLTMDFPGFEGIPLNNVFPNAMGPPTYADGFGDIPTYDTRSVVPSAEASKPRH